MIPLRPDCPAFESPNEDFASASAAGAQFTIELASSMAPFLDESTLHNVALGVLHYFQQELGQETVSAGEFAHAFEQALKGLGFDATTHAVSPSSPRILETDLQGLVPAGSPGLELTFFPRLRAELRRHLEQAPHLLRFRGLRPCVKQLIGARRWSGRCQGLNDQIVEYLRSCLRNEQGEVSCALVVW